MSDSDASTNKRASTTPSLEEDQEGAAPLTDDEVRERLMDRLTGEFEEAVDALPGDFGTSPGEAWGAMLRAADGSPLGQPEPADPAQIAATAMVLRLLEVDPGLKARARQPGAVIVVEVPGAEWVEPIAEAWRELIHAATRAATDRGEQEGSGHKGEGANSAWVAFRRDGKSRDHRPDEGNRAVRAVVASGRPVYGFSPSPARFLPSDLMRAATERVTIGLPDAPALIETATILTGAPPVTVSIGAEVAARVTVADLWLARRPGQDAEAYLTRLAQLACRQIGDQALRLDGLHGMDEAVRWGKDVARDLADYAVGTLPWREVDRGAVLFGPTGTGKTTFAKALAAQCGVHLVTGSLAQWQGAQEGHLGTTLGAMQRTFDDARKAAPCILLVDEIDAFGDRAAFGRRERGYAVQVVNAFLEELDGAAGREGVVVVGCCNDASRLDPAILRPGRLERLIQVPLPDQAALAAILRHHLGDELPDADLSRLALIGLGSTGADAERWVRGMRRRARHDRRGGTLSDLEAEVRGRASSPPLASLNRTAVHEAGHAVMVALERPGALVAATIVPSRGLAGRVHWKQVDETRPALTRAALLATLREALAGRAAEEELLGGASATSGGGVESDLSRATWLATVAVTALGLDEGRDALVWRGMPDAADVPTLLAEQPDVARRVAGMLDAAYAEARTVVRRHAAVIRRLADLLVDREIVSRAEVEALVAGEGAAGEV
ncbi:AAA family ATPase [Roseomonas sp. E05]|uniref:AAA family ATPase n=1 Tax=Roseomonas sp. E05 TaxID=3046310 RepID=UPI0024BB9745|nr:AAA family ATPase [Roseomonas sp. E05]MDJ0390066.1 AAA family ATPase [Roseomonas sp. E05]